jgi:hypothetical protein
METRWLNMVELVGIEPPQWVENIQLADSTMLSKGRKGTNSNSAVQIGTSNQAVYCPQHSAKRVCTDMFSLRRILDTKANSAMIILQFPVGLRSAFQS